MGLDLGSGYLPQKKLFPPVSTTTRTASSLDAWSKLCNSWSISSCERALRLVGRLNVSTLTPSAGVEGTTSDSGPPEAILGNLTSGTIVTRGGDKVVGGMAGSQSVKYENWLRARRTENDDSESAVCEISRDEGPDDRERRLAVFFTAL